LLSLLPSGSGYGRSLTSHLAKDAPYRNTKVSYGDTKNDIEEMLKEAGAIALRWTESPDSMRGVALPILEFIFPIEWNGIQKNFGVKIQPPLLASRKRAYGRRGATIEMSDRNASMRLLFWYLKAKLEAVRFGMDDVFTAFMSRVINQLPDGTNITLGDTVKEHPQLLKELLPSFEIKPRQLEQRNET